MVTETKKYPITLAERMELGKEAQYFTGSLQEFVELADACEYPVEFNNGTIIAMSIASDPHEQIVANLLYILVGIFKGNKNYKRYGSNRHVFSESTQNAFSPDASIIKGAPDIFEYSKGKTANKNPWLIVEILSPSTRKRDWGEKFPVYKEMESMQYIIYVEQDMPMVTVFERMENSTRWMSKEYNDLSQSFEIAGKTVLVEDIYENALEEKK